MFIVKHNIKFKKKYLKLGACYKIYLTKIFPD